MALPGLFGLVVDIIAPEYVGHVLAQQENITRPEAANVIAYDELAFTFQNAAQLYFGVLVQLVVEVGLAVHLVADQLPAWLRYFKRDDLHAGTMLANIRITCKIQVNIVSVVTNPVQDFAYLILYI